jgi:hypothetical protein
MKNDFSASDESDRGKALKDLMEDLRLFSDSTNDSAASTEDSLDLIIDQALSGVDIRKRFPAFYQKLLQNKSLRQEFIDAITIIAGLKDRAVDLHLNKSKLDFSFLQKNQPQVSGWPVFLKQNKEQLMNVFFPIQAAYRDGGNIGSTPVYTLLRKDFVLGQTSYTVLLESNLAESEEEVLRTTLSLTTNNEGATKAFPVQASLRWGDYSSELMLSQEGKHPLPDIPLSAIFTSDLEQVKADLFLSLNTSVK